MAQYISCRYMCLEISLTHLFSTPPRQVARAGRFGTKGLAITFVSDETDAKILNDVQDRFEVNVAELPDEIDISSYSKSFHFHSLSNIQASLDDLIKVSLMGCVCVSDPSE